MSNAQKESIFQAGNWYDHSLLEFDNRCGGDLNRIYAYIKNAGIDDMAHDSKYCVYYSPPEYPIGPQGVIGELVFSQGAPSVRNTQQPCILSLM